MAALVNVDADDAFGLGRRRLELHALDRDLARLVERGGEVLELDVAADGADAGEQAAMSDVIDATAHHHLDRTIAGVKQRPEILARQVRRERAAVVGAEAAVAVAVHDAGADGDELEEMLVPFEPLDG